MRGPILMVFASLAFTLMVACVKVARVELSALKSLHGGVSVPSLWRAGGLGKPLGR